MGMLAELSRHALEQLSLHLQRRFTQCKSGAVGYAEKVCVRGNGGFTECGVQYHVGRFSANTGQCFELRPAARDFSPVLPDQDFAATDDISSLGIE